MDRSLKLKHHQVLVEIAVADPEGARLGAVADKAEAFVEPPRGGVGCGDGEVHLLLNRCAHRANLVCEDARGNSSSFRCPYHGWTFRNTGELLGYPYNKGYGGKGKLDLGMGRVPRVESYRGFVFGSFAFVA